MLTDVLIEKGYSIIEINLANFFQVLLSDLGEKSPCFKHLFHGLLRFFGFCFLWIERDG